LPERRPLRVVHTSDVHLGAYSLSKDTAWDSRRNLMERAFSRVIDLGREVHAHALLIAGDFFDNDRVPQHTIDFAAEELRRFGGPVFLLSGNHDPMDEGRIYARNPLDELVPGLRMFRSHAGESFEIPGADAVVWGRGYLESDWHFRPLHGLPARSGERWHIAMAHGHFVRADSDRHRSLLIEQHEIEAAAGDCDYIALGHWEPHADVSAGGMTAVYSGAPLALSDANQKAGWAAVVDFDGDGVRWALRRVDPREGIGP